MQLSTFFTLAEMTRSDTATRLGIANQPDAPALQNLTTLCAAVLDPLREAVQSSIKVNSGYRGPELNARIGGAKKSQHMEGKAADIQSQSISVLELFKTVVRLKLPYDQVIFEAKNRNTKWVHVSHDPSRARGQILVASFSADGSKVTYRGVTEQEALDLTDPIPATRGGGPVELEYEELPDEPDFDVEPEETQVSTAEPEASERAVAVRRPAKARPKAKAKAAPKRNTAAKKKSAPKRKSVAKRKPAAKRKSTPKPKSAPKRKPAAKRVRAKAKKHK